MAGPAAWGLFLLVNATLFVRPAEIVPGLAGWPIYEVLIVGCLALCLPTVVQQLAGRNLGAHPVSACVLGVLVAAIISLAAHGDWSGLEVWGLTMVKVVLYYLVLMALVDTPQRLRRLAAWLVLCLAAATLPPLLQYHGLVHNAALTTLQDRATDASGREILVPRLQGAGIFNDPNDLAQILAVGVALAAYLFARGTPAAKPLWAGAVVMFVYAIGLTQSRGGFLALLAGVVALLGLRWGWGRAALMMLVAVPALLALASGRQAEISTDQETGQERIQLWSDALVAFHGNPLLGVGPGSFNKEGGMVAHNSFLQCYAEMGLIGGSLFLGAFYLVLSHVRRLGQQGVTVMDLELRRMRPYVGAAVAAYAVGMLSLSRAYVVPTYSVLGMAAAYGQMASTWPPLAPMQLSGRLLWRLAGISGLFLAAMTIFVRMAVRW